MFKISGLLCLRFKISRLLDSDTTTSRFVDIKISRFRDVRIPRIPNVKWKLNLGRTRRDF